MISLIFASANLYAQDIHFSQYDMSPLNLNPAYSGYFNEDLRFIFNHRNQWQSVTKPYKTFSGSFDNKVKIKDHAFGAGVLVNQDKAGDSKFGTFQLSVSLAKHLVISADSNLRLGIGIQGGLVNRSIDYEDLYFDKQFDGDVFDKSLPTGEQFSTSGFMYFDLSLGASIAYKVGETTDLHTGFALHHLNKPKQSFFDNTAVKLRERFSTDISIASVPAFKKACIVCAGTFNNVPNNKTIDKIDILIDILINRTNFSGCINSFNICDHID